MSRCTPTEQRSSAAAQHSSTSAPQPTCTPAHTSTPEYLVLALSVDYSMCCIIHLNGKVDPADEPVEHAVVHGRREGVGSAVRHVRPIQGQCDLRPPLSSSSSSSIAVIRECGTKQKTRHGSRSLIHPFVCLFGNFIHSIHAFVYSFVHLIVRSFV